MYYSTATELIHTILTTELTPQDDLMIFVGEASAQYVPELISTLNHYKLSFFGGIFPSLLVGSHAHAEGFILKCFKPIYRQTVLPYLMSFDLPKESYEDCTALVLADGLSSQYQALIDTLYKKLDANVHYIGGGAGFYDMKHRPCLFNEKGMLQDAMIVCLLPTPCQYAVSHGFKILDGPYHITQSIDNVLSALDYCNAFDVYSDVIEAHEGIRLFQSDFFLYAKEHPFGIILPHTHELIVRDPICVNADGEITCVTNVPEGSELFILSGNTNSLLLSSSQIVQECHAHESSITTSEASPLLFDCISRAMFMGKSFSTELTNIQAQLYNQTLGTLCIGEITSHSSGKAIIHNKSTVLCLLQSA